MEVDYLPDEMNAYAKGMKLPEISEFYRGWRAACEAMHKKAQAKAPPGHIIDDQDNVRKVLGEFQLTKDGVIALPGSFVYAKWWHDKAVKGFVRHEIHGPETCCFVEMTTTTPDGRTIGVRSFLGDCYSTREAAEAARGT
jgi:hypothetical protein